MLNLKISVKSLTTPESVGVSCEDLSLEFSFSVKDLCDPEYMAVLCAHVQNLLDKPQIKQIIEAVLKDAGIDLPPVVTEQVGKHPAGYWGGIFAKDPDEQTSNLSPEAEKIMDLEQIERKYFPAGLSEEEKSALDGMKQNNASFAPHANKDAARALIVNLIKDGKQGWFTPMGAYYMIDNHGWMLPMEPVPVDQSSEIDAFKAKYFPKGLNMALQERLWDMKKFPFDEENMGLAFHANEYPVCMEKQSANNGNGLVKWVSPLVGLHLLENPDLGWTLVTNQKIRDTIAEAKQQSGLSSPSTDFFKLHWPEGMNAAEGDYLNTIQKAFNAGELRPINAGYQIRQTELGAVIPMTNLIMHRFEVTLYFTKCYAYFLLTHPELGWKLVKEPTKEHSDRRSTEWTTCSKCSEPIRTNSHQDACPHCGHLN